MFSPDWGSRRETAIWKRRAGGEFTFLGLGVLLRKTGLENVDFLLLFLLK